MRADDKADGAGEIVHACNSAKEAVVSEKKQESTLLCTIRETLLTLPECRRQSRRW